MLKKIVLLAIITLFMSCKTDDGEPDCAAVACAVPVVIVNFIDSMTSQNYFVENNITRADVQIKNGANNQIELIFDETTGILFISRLSNVDQLNIVLKSNISTTISYTVASPKTNHCCDFGSLENIMVENKTFEVDNDTITIYL